MHVALVLSYFRANRTSAFPSGGKWDHLKRNSGATFPFKLSGCMITGSRVNRWKELEAAGEN